MEEMRNGARPQWFEMGRTFDFGRWTFSGALKQRAALTASVDRTKRGLSVHREKIVRETGNRYGFSTCVLILLSSKPPNCSADDLLKEGEEGEDDRKNYQLTEREVDYRIFIERTPISPRTNHRPSPSPPLSHSTRISLSPSHHLTCALFHHQSW